MSTINLPVHLRTSDAPLPKSYEAAKAALANCTSLDECRDWADKAEALASYARQADDATLVQYAHRIQARAVRRCGELLKQFDGRGRPAENVEGDHNILPPSRKQVAERAGISPHQTAQAVRVANISPETFTAMVDSPAPPTVTKLADMGRTPRAEPTLPPPAPPRPAGFQQATALLGTVRRFAEFCAANDPELIAGGVLPHEAADTREQVATIDAWLDRFVINLKG